jgi:3-oxoadipate enol-lactonase
MSALAAVRCPTLLLVGSDDLFVPVSAMRQVAERRKESELAVVPQAGHSDYFEKPEELNRLVIDFIARRARY